VAEVTLDGVAGVTVVNIKGTSIDTGAVCEEGFVFLDETVGATPGPDGVWRSDSLLMLLCHASEREMTAS